MARRYVYVKEHGARLTDLVLHHHGHYLVAGRPPRGVWRGSRGIRHRGQDPECGEEPGRQAEEDGQDRQKRRD
jgi:hypothetical protein